jgi:glycerol-3-phosphate dehydrogenase subunit C
MCELLGYRVVIPKTRCSAHALETYGGDITPNAQHNIRVLEEAGADAPILTTCSSCRLSLVKQYPEWFWKDAHWKARAEAISARVQDAAYFGAQHLRDNERRDGHDIAYHAPCHALALSQMGKPGGEEALANPRGHANYHNIEQHCSGMGGTFGFKLKNRTIMEVNSDLMTGHLQPLPRDTTVYTDCPSCRLALEEKSPRPADHPVNAVYEWLKLERA